MTSQWHNKAQEAWSNSLVLCRLRGFPPWPSQVIKPQPRSTLQGPMNPLPPPADSVFDREVKCVCRGRGFKQGETVSAHFYHTPASYRPPVKSTAKQKAIVVRLGTKKMKVKFKQDGRIERIPKEWAELNSSSTQQMRTTGFVKKPIGKTRDVALRGRAKGKVPTGQVLVYSYGDEMYRKVRVSALMPFSRADLSRPYGGKGGTVEKALRAFAARGFNGQTALSEALAELNRREADQRSKMIAAREQVDFRRAHSEASTPVRMASRPEPLWTPDPVKSQDATTDSSESDSSESDSDDRPDYASLIQSRAAAQERSRRLAGTIVPFSHQLDIGDATPAPVSSGQIADARRLLGFTNEEALDRTGVNRARRRLALKYHPDKALPANKAWAQQRWLEIDAAHLLLLQRL